MFVMSARAEEDMKSASPECPRIQPFLDIGKPEPRATAKLGAAAAELIFARETWRPACAQPVDLAPGQPG